MVTPTSIIKGTSFFSFIIASVSIGAIFYIFTSSNLSLFFVMSVGAVILSLLVLKTGFFLTKVKEDGGAEAVEIISRFKLGLKKRDAGLVFFRLLFFNVLNDLFMILVCWLALFGIISIISSILLGTVLVSNLANFVYVMTLLGIVAGFFQYYIKNYRENVTNRMTKHVGKLIYSTISRKISFKEFLAFTQNKDSSFHRKLDDITSERRLILPFMGMAGRLPGKDIHFSVLHLEAMSDSNLFTLVENSEKIGQTKLKELYKEFFEIKTHEIKNEIREKNIEQLRKLLLPHIQFFDDLLVNVLVFEEAYEIEEPETYQEFIRKASSECTFYLVDLILRGGVESEAQTKSQ